MADNRTMAQMLQAPIEGYEDAIVVPPINANNFELKQPLINLVQSNKFTDWIEDALVEMPKLNKWNKVPEKLEDPGSPNELAPLAPLPRGGNDDSTLKKDLHEENFQEDVEIKNSNVSDEPVFLNTPLSDKDECFAPKDDNDEIDDFLAMEVWICSKYHKKSVRKRTRDNGLSNQEAKDLKPKPEEIMPQLTTTNRPTKRLNLHVSSISLLPKSYRDAFNDPNWQNAMNDEYHALNKNNTWTLVPRPTNANIVRCMWLFHHKYLADGMLSRYKARLVANGSTQLEGVDVDETFSLVVKPGAIGTVISLVASRHWPIHQLDVKNAFLHGDLSETVYMHQPLGRFGLYIHNRGELFLSALTTDLAVVRGTLDYGLKLFLLSTIGFGAYLDVDWAGCPTTRCSTLSYCVFLGNNLLSCSSKRQLMLSRSCAEAEYRGVANAIAETCWL
ncbi:ribonuclease H-like domain-containing protein [Tanacetum coccineum]|uniref:Ribonuclease H-like domain-containing protein n=1 Tax=Tanacetum coccineum TaxID=301880 RepID=A0ABQ5E1I3_9ASTR